MSQIQVRGINELLKDYEQYGGLAFHWRMLSSSGHDRRPNGSVGSAYTKCFPESYKKSKYLRQIKLFLNTKYVHVRAS